MPASSSSRAGDCRKCTDLPISARLRESIELVPTSTPVLKRVPIGPCPSGKQFGISKCISFTNSPGTFHSTAFVLSPWASECASKPFKSAISVSSQPFGSLGCNPTVFQSWMLWRLISPVPVSKSSAQTQECLL